MGISFSGTTEHLDAEAEAFIADLKALIEKHAAGMISAAAAIVDDAGTTQVNLMPAPPEPTEAEAASGPAAGQPPTAPSADVPAAVEGRFQQIESTLETIGEGLKELLKGR